MAGETVLLLASKMTGGEKLVHMLLRNGADVHMASEHGDTALSVAALFGNSATAAALLVYGAVPGDLLPQLARNRGHEATARFLAAVCALPRLAPSAFGSSASPHLALTSSASALSRAGAGAGTGAGGGGGASSSAALGSSVGGAGGGGDEGPAVVAFAVDPTPLRLLLMRQGFTRATKALNKVGRVGGWSVVLVLLLLLLLLLLSIINYFYPLLIIIIYLFIIYYLLFIIFYYFFLLLLLLILLLLLLLLLLFLDFLFLLGSSSLIVFEGYISSLSI